MKCEENCKDLFLLLIAVILEPHLSNINVSVLFTIYLQRLNPFYGVMGYTVV